MYLAFRRCLMSNEELEARINKDLEEWYYERLLKLEDLADTAEEIHNKASEIASITDDIGAEDIPQLDIFMIKMYAQRILEVLSVVEEGLKEV